MSKPPSGVPLTIVDAFTAEPFAGNPAAVCLLAEPADAGWMQRLAAEMNLSETAFLVPQGEDRFGLRWFTPEVEVPICGHATIASAHVLYEAGHVDPGARVAFETLSGRHEATREDGWIALRFPRFDAAPEELPAPLAEALGIRPPRCARLVGDPFAEPAWIAQLDDEAAVRACAPDFSNGAGWPGSVIVTARASDEPADFVSRFFAPVAGIPEDPVTGAAHCALAPWWAAQLGRDELVGRQISARGGTVRVRLVDEGVRLAGQAVTVVRGAVA